MWLPLISFLNSFIFHNKFKMEISRENAFGSSLECQKIFSLFLKKNLNYYREKQTKLNNSLFVDLNNGNLNAFCPWWELEEKIHNKHLYVSLLLSKKHRYRWWKTHWHLSMSVDQKKVTYSKAKQSASITVNIIKQCQLFWK